MARPSSIRSVIEGSALGLVLLVSHGPASAATGCRIGTLGTQHVELLKNRHVTIEGSVNGQPIRALIDTGASLTSLGRKFAQKASLDLHPALATAYGIGGSTNIDLAYVKTLTFGPMEAKRVDVPIIDDIGEALGWDGILGADILFGHDLEIALAAGELRWVIPDGCHDEFLAYWDREASVLPMSRLSRDDHRQVITLQINGHDLRALIDSGASTSVIDTAAAARVGVTRDSSEVLSEGKAGGIGPRKIDWWIAPFHKVVIGRESISDTRLSVGDLRSGFREEATTTTRIQRQIDTGHDMILGADFLKSHRVLFSVQQQQFYFSYVGGHIFAIDR
jgi:predicted aspartyl protease